MERHNSGRSLRILVLLIAALALGGGKGIASWQEAAGKAPAEVSDKTRKAKAQRPEGIEIPACLADRDEEIVPHEGFTLSYNRSRLLPNWVAWTLTAERTQGTVGRYNTFRADSSVIEGPVARDADYRRSGYDRGHQCPAADCKHSEQSMRDCFLLTNICPQTHALNNGDWKSLETLCRKWACEYDSIFIVCGPVIESGEQYETIGERGVTVPKQFYKVVLRLTDEGGAEAVGFLFDNGTERKPLEAHAVSVDSVEVRTGIDFFTELPEHVEQRAEASYDCSQWLDLGEDSP